jgi:hypothetical protein
MIPEDQLAKLDLYLFSPVEGRVPFAAYQAFFCERMKEFFDKLENSSVRPPDSTTDR